MPKNWKCQAMAKSLVICKSGNVKIQFGVFVVDFKYAYLKSRGGALTAAPDSKLDRGF